VIFKHAQLKDTLIQNTHGTVLGLIQQVIGPTPNMLLNPIQQVIGSNPKSWSLIL
jgi:hypothetical protein